MTTTDLDLMPPAKPLAEASTRLRKKPRPPKTWVPFAKWAKPLFWLDRTPLLDVVEPYRLAIFTEALDTFDDRGRLKYNRVLCGRAKKNFKSGDMIVAGLYALLANDSDGGNDCFILANDGDQAAQDLDIAKKIIRANPKTLGEQLVIKKDEVARKDGLGFLKILPAGDIIGSHGKTYRFCAFDEIHGYTDWQIFEAMQFDPTRTDSQQWITSYASIHHKPGAPLYDMFEQGRTGKNPRMLFSWFAADYCTDASLTEATPEERANPSMKGDRWDPDYLTQQAATLPAHMYRRLHLNLPGLPEGSAFTLEKILAAVDTGVTARPGVMGYTYKAFVDMSGGSSDDSVLCIGHLDEEKRVVIDYLGNQGQIPPFDPERAVKKFCPILDLYRVRSVTSDDYAGQTFRAKFSSVGSITVHRIQKDIRSASDLYEAMETPLNSGRIVLLDIPVLTQQLTALQWKGSKITHPNGEHDDWANAVAGVVYMLTGQKGWGILGAWSIDQSTTGEVSIKMGKAPRETLHDPREQFKGIPMDQIHPHERIERIGPSEMSERKAEAWRQASKGRRRT